MALVIEADAQVAEMTAGMLRSEGFDVAVATTAHDAREQLEQNEFDLVMADFVMPDLGAMTLYGELMRSRPMMARRLIFTTPGFLTSETLRFLEELKLVLVAKPYTRVTLRDAIARMLRRL